MLNERKRDMVLVMETLPDRRAGYVDFSELPVELAALKQVALDPLVGFKTSAARNEADEQLPDFSDER